MNCEDTPPQRRDLFRLIRRTMCCACMWPLQLERYFPHWLRQVATFLELISELFLYFAAVHIAVLYLCTLYLHFDDGDLEFLVNCLMQTLIFAWTIITKVYFRRGQTRRLAHLVDFINLRYQTRSSAAAWLSLGFTYVTMDDALALSNRYIGAYSYCCFGGAIFWLVLPLAYGDRSLPLDCWYPFDYKAPVVYETMYFLQFVAQLQVAAAFSASSGFYMVLAILLAGQYDVLFCSLKNLIASAYINAGATRAQLIQLKGQQVIASDVLNEYYCAKERSLEMACLLRTVNSSNQPNADHFKIALKSSLKACVVQHRYITKALRKMEDFYNPIWFFKTGEVIFLMCLVAFVSVKSTTANSSFMKILSLAQYLLLVALEMLLICYFGEIISQHSQRCGEALLRCPWPLHMREMKRDLQIFLVHSQRSFVLTAGKLLALNVRLFKSIMSTAFSFLTFLKTMDERN